MKDDDEPLSPVVSMMLRNLPALEPRSLDCLERTIWRFAGHGGLRTRSLVASWTVDPRRIAVVLREPDGHCLGYLSPPADDTGADIGFAEELLHLEASMCSIERAGIQWNDDPTALVLPWAANVWRPESPLTFPDQVVLPWRPVPTLSNDTMMRRIQQIESQWLSETTMAHAILSPVRRSEGNVRVVAAWAISADMWFILRARRYRPQSTGVPGEPPEMPPGLADHIWPDQRYLLHATPWEPMDPQLPSQGYRVFDRSWIATLNDPYEEYKSDHYGLVVGSSGPSVPVEGFYGLDEPWLPPVNRPFLAAVRQAIAIPPSHH
ncbi:MAG: hypothetical protein L0G99_16455 [Propionibacteriales bacterium]|nr:hypothetical protein [Propionibacteriales bacterium]